MLTTQNENVLDVAPDYKLYSRFAINIAAFFGGPIAMGYVFAQNFKMMNEPVKASRSILIGIGSMVVIILLVMFVPAVDSIPNFIFPVMYVAAGGGLFIHYQQNLVESHTAAGGSLYSNWRAVLIGVIGFAILFTIMVIVYVLTDPEFARILSGEGI